MKPRHFATVALGGALGLLGACAVRPPLIARTTSRGVAPVALRMAPGGLDTAGTLLAQGQLAPTDGLVRLDIRWPTRSSFAVQTIPSSANALEIQITDATGSLLTSDLLVRPNHGTLQTTANLAVPAGTNRLITVAAYTEQSPGAGSVPIAAGTASIAVAPSTVANAVLNLAPAFPPTITAMTPNGGPGAYVTLTGQNFGGNGGPVYVVFAAGATASFLLSSTATQLEAVLPASASDGPVSVWADGVTGMSSSSFAVLASLAVAPLTAAATVGKPVTFTISSQDVSGSSVASPQVGWTWGQTDLSPNPLAPAPPASTMSAGVFTPGATGTFLIEAYTGTLVGTASVTAK